MRYQDLLYHCERYGCTLDHLEDDLYIATNCVNANICQIEELSEYSEVTIIHYCFELGIPAPEGYEKALDKYRQLREDIANLVGNVAVQMDDSEEE